MRAVLEVRERTSGDVASPLQGLGNINRQRGDLDDAETYLRRALAAARDPQRADGSRANLGGLLVRRGRLEEAEALCARAAEGLKAARGFSRMSSFAARLCLAEESPSRAATPPARCRPSTW